MGLGLENVVFECKDVCLNEESSKVYEFAVKSAVYNHRSNDASIYTLFFAKSRILKIWNLYPDLRDGIFQNIIMWPLIWKNSLTKEDSLQLLLDCATICKEIAEKNKDNLSPDWGRIQDRMEELNYIKVDRDLLGNLKKLSDNQTGPIYGYWLNRYLNTLDSSNKQEFEDIYFSINKAPGATEVKKIIIEAAISKQVFSDKILNKVSKSAPISIRRSIVKALAAQKRKYNCSLHYWKAKYGNYSEKQIEDEKEKAAMIDKMLMLFSAIQDFQIQESLVVSLDKENLVWIVPAISAIGDGYLSAKLQNRMSQ